VNLYFKFIKFALSICGLVVVKADRHRVKCCGIMFDAADSKKPLHSGSVHPFANPANLMSLAAEFHKSVIGPPAFPYPPHLAAAAAAAAAGPFAFMPLTHPGMMNFAAIPNHLQAGLRTADHVTTHAGQEVTSSRGLP